MLKRVLIWFALVIPGFAPAFDVLPIDTFYNPILAQNAAWSSLNYANTLSNIPPIDTPIRVSPNGESNSTRTPPLPGKRRATATIKKLTSAYPAGVRADAKRLFNQLYNGYGQIERSIGIPKYDLAGAVAAFITANYMAYNNVDVPDADFTAFVDQTRRALRSNRTFAKLKRELYEQFAILGTFVATTRLALQQQPNADISLKLHDAAKAYLEQLLKVSADRVFVTSSGLIIQ